MTDHNDREDHPTEPPLPWERGTGEGVAEAMTMPPSDLGKTQELPEPTLRDLFTQFQLFQEKILNVLSDERKSTVDAVREVGDELYEQYERLSKDLFDLRTTVRGLRRRTHTHATHIQQMEVRLNEVFDRLDAIDKQGAPHVEPMKTDSENGGTPSPDLDDRKG